MRTFTTLAALTVLTASLLAGDARAQPADDCNFVQRAPSTEELIDCLAGPPRVRGIRRVDETSGQPATPEPPPAASLMVIFEFDSADLTSEARQVLDTLGQALQASPLQSSRFVVEGHTDAVGTEVYNQSLSERRAESVASYLHGRYGIEPGRMSTVGKGQHELLDPSDPHAPINRRVRIVNLGEG